jgi:adenylyltransferase/sulfurtransferase
MDEFDITLGEAEEKFYRQEEAPKEQSGIVISADDFNEDRYSRLRLIPWWDQEKLRTARTMVVGAGAIGNELLKNLALLGIGHIFAIDMDRIENSNLTRSILFRQKDEGRYKAEVAAERVREINPDTKSLYLTVM